MVSKVSIRVIEILVGIYGIKISDNFNIYIIIIILTLFTASSAYGAQAKFICSL